MPDPVMAAILPKNCCVKSERDSHTKQKELTWAYQQYSHFWCCSSHRGLDLPSPAICLGCANVKTRYSLPAIAAICAFTYGWKSDSGQVELLL